MVVEVRMPKLGLTMTKGVIKKWLKSEGDRVNKGEALLVIETEKITANVESPASGYLLKIVAPVGTAVPVGGTVAYVGELGEAVPEVVAAQPPPTKPVERAVPEVPTAPPPVKVRATPRARMIAEREGIDLSLIRGSGPGGLIVEEDVIRYVEEVRKRTKTGLRVRESIPLTSLRMTIAERMTESLRTMAQVTICREESVDNIVKLREELTPIIEKEVGIRLTYTPILIKLVAEALREFPIMNSTLEDNVLKVIDEINIGFAVAVDHGLVVPVVREADKKSLKELAVISNELVRKAREGRLSIEDVSGGTFTITNLGMYGVDAFTPIINPPQVAILGVGRFVQKPVVQEGKIGISTLCTFSLTFDHRVIDGHTAAQFLDKLISMIRDEGRLRGILSVK